MIAARPRLAGGGWRSFALIAILTLGGGCESREPAHPLPVAEWNTHYFPDCEHGVDEQSLAGTTTHLVAFNPNHRPADLQVTAYFEDRDPVTFSLKSGWNRSTESNSARWPILGKSRFALRIRSDLPVVCQATIGWTNTANKYEPGAETKSSRGPRECAASYLSVRQSATQWHVADGIVLNDPQNLWIRESEWLVVLNPTNQPAELSLLLHEAGRTIRHQWTVAPQRVHRTLIDPLVAINRHHGVTLNSSVPVVANWRRHVEWYGSEERMTFWTIPAVAVDLPDVSTKPPESMEHELSTDSGDSNEAVRD